MSSATDTLENGLALLLFNNIALAGVGDAAGILGSAAAGNLYMSLHTAPPGEAGNQSTSEANYPGYARVPMPRTAAAWQVSANNWQNLVTAQFPASTGGSNTIVSVGIGTEPTGAGKLLYQAPLGDPSSLTVTAGMAPKIDPGVAKGSIN